MHVDGHATGAQSAEARHNRERDAIAGAAAGEPRPATVAIAKILEPGKGGLHFIFSAGGIKQEGNSGACLAFIDSITHPRCLSQQRLDQISVSFEWTFQCIGSFPLRKDLGNLRIAGSDVPGKAVGIQTRKQRLRAFVALFHDRWQRQYGIPSRIGSRLDH